MNYLSLNEKLTKTSLSCHDLTPVARRAVSDQRVEPIAKINLMSQCAVKASNPTGKFPFACFRLFKVVSSNFNTLTEHQDTVMF